jgi:hypothetical protein
MPAGLAGDRQIVGADRGPTGLEGRPDLAGRPGVLVPDGSSSSGPAKNDSSRRSLACRRVLLAAPYHSSKAATAGTATSSPRLMTCSRWRRTSWGLPLMIAMQALVSSR